MKSNLLITISVGLNLQGGPNASVSDNAFMSFMINKLYG